MTKVYKNDVINFEEMEINDSGSVFEQILESRKREIDSKRFFLRYISPEDLDRYDFSNLESLKEFRNRCVVGTNPLVPMGGCNVREESIEKGLRYSGMKLSDPSKEIRGTFDRHGDILTYSPIFPMFYEERDLCKFARDVYFSTLTFEELLMREIDEASDYYLHVGRYSNAKEIAKNGQYKMEQISKDDMINYATNPEMGEEVYRKYLKY